MIIDDARNENLYHSLVDRAVSLTQRISEATNVSLQIREEKIAIASTRYYKDVETYKGVNENKLMAEARRAAVLISQIARQKPIVFNVSEADSQFITDTKIYANADFAVFSGFSEMGIENVQGLISKPTFDVVRELLTYNFVGSNELMLFTCPIFDMYHQGKV